MMPSLRTERLVLRPLEARDDGRFWRLRTDPVVRQWLEATPWPTVDRAREERLKLQAGIEADKWYFWALAEGPGRPLIGTVCLWNFGPQRDDCELGFELFASHQGKGLMREAVACVLDWAWASLPLKTISALTHRDNVAARALLASQGFQEGPLPEDWDVSDDEKRTQVFARRERPSAPTALP